MYFSEHYDLTHLNTMKLVSTARYFAQPTNIDEVFECLNSDYAKQLGVFVLGGGSNILLSEKIEKLVIQPKLMGITVLDDTPEYVKIKVGAGENWHDFVQQTLANNWFGLENLSLIYGSVGACPVQNIGAYGVEVKDVITTVEAIHLPSLTSHSMSNEQCLFTYRDSKFKHEAGDWLITHVCFKLSKHPNLKLGYGDVASQAGENPTPLKVAQTITHIREQKLPNPSISPNCGSFFKNPIVEKQLADALKQSYPNLPVYPYTETQCKLPAGWLIEQAGFKGKQINHMKMYEKQALVMVNAGNAKLEDVLSFETTVIKAVHQKFQVMLEREPVIVI